MAKPSARYETVIVDPNECVKAHLNFVRHEQTSQRPANGRRSTAPLKTSKTLSPCFQHQRVPVKLFRNESKDDMLTSTCGNCVRDLDLRLAILDFSTGFGFPALLADFRRIPSACQQTNKSFKTRKNFRILMFIQYRSLYIPIAQPPSRKGFRWPYPNAVRSC